MQYVHRRYRNRVSTPGLVSFTVAVQETDLLISAALDLSTPAYDAVLQARAFLDSHIKRCPSFRTSLVPLPPDPHAPLLIQEMLAAGEACSVGPMAAVAGAVAEYVGKRLLKLSGEVIVENGGDIWFSVQRPINAAVFAGASPLSERIGIRIAPDMSPLGLCTSSGTVGPSLSFGKADAVTVLAASAALADAAATALGNRVQTKDDIAAALDAARSIQGITGALIIVADALGAWGNIELVDSA